MNIATALLTGWAFADKAADLVQTFSLVQTGRADALIYLNLTVSPLKSCKYDVKQVVRISQQTRGLIPFLLQLHFNLVASHLLNRQIVINSTEDQMFLLTMC